MKRFVFALAALAVLSATPAFAGYVDEVAQDKNVPNQIVASPDTIKGTGRIVNGEVDGLLEPARIESLRFASHPGVDNLNESGGR